MTLKNGHDAARTDPQSKKPWNDKIIPGQLNILTGMDPLNKTDPTILSSFIQTLLSASEFHRIMPCGSWAVPPVGNCTLPWRCMFYQRGQYTPAWRILSSIILAQCRKKYVGSPKPARQMRGQKRSETVRWDRGFCTRMNDTKHREYRTQKRTCAD